MHIINICDHLFCALCLNVSKKRKKKNSQQYDTYLHNRKYEMKQYTTIHCSKDYDIIHLFCSTHLHIII